jgi:hypothetical protein
MAPLPAPTHGHDLAGLGPVLAERRLLLDQLDRPLGADPGDRSAVWRRLDALLTEVERRPPARRRR